MSNSATDVRLHPIQHLIYICSRYIAYGLPMLLFLVVSTFYLKTYDSAQIKITVTQMGTISLAMVWFVKIILEGRLPFGKMEFVYVAPFVFFLLSGLVAYIHTPFKAWSEEETARRVFYMIIALITISEIRSKENMIRINRWFLLSAWVIVGYGLVQYIDSRFFRGQGQGIDPFIWRGAFGPRVFSTFGNPNFYGNFLVILTPLALAGILKEKGALFKPFLLLFIVALMALIIDKITLSLYGGVAPSLQLVFNTVLLVIIVLFIYLIFSGGKSNSSLAYRYLFFSFLFLNLYSTETKGAWVGFTAAMGASMWLVLEYFLHLDEHEIQNKKYLSYVFVFLGLYILLLLAMAYAFIFPLFHRSAEQIGLHILVIPTIIATVISVFMVLWMIKKPWNLKKIIYGGLVFFILFMGGGVLQFAKTRLVSVSFRMFTWISTWEMIRTSPLVGNGVGTFKVIYPAYRRPEIIVLEGKSNTETDHSEDEYLEIWQDEGIVGFGIFLWMVFTAIYCGLKQLRWYSLLRVPDRSKNKDILEMESPAEAFDVLGYLGAYIGALMHWFVDVSVRFVSSGVFSGFLPGILVAMGRNRVSPINEYPRQRYEKWIRLSVALTWVIIFLWLKLELVPQALIQFGDTSMSQIVFWILLAGGGLFAVMELMEYGELKEPEAAQSREIPASVSSTLPLKVILVTCVIWGGLYGMKYFGQQFHGDVHHNMAIFFSKEGIWTKSPLYDSKMQNYPPDIRKKYQKTGGALEHYAAVNKMNHAFPMAYYFTGNVYNDWGSQIFADSVNKRNAGDREEANRLSDKAFEMWEKAEDAYAHTKSLAPNYVQTHHQMGLLNLKRAEQAGFSGDQVKAQAFYDQALKDFQKYRIIDPVFPPNYERIAQILLMRGQIDEVIALYREAIYYNDVTARSIHNYAYSDRIAPLALNLAKLYLSVATKKKAQPFSPPLSEVTEALTYFKMACENDPKNGEAWKGYGYVLEKCGKNQEAQEAYRKAYELIPNDPSWRSIPHS